MKNELLLWLVLGGWASLLLLAMMRRRQQALDSLLHGYVQRQTQLAARRQKAARVAAKSAAKRAAKSGPAGDATAADAAPTQAGAKQR